MLTLTFSANRLVSYKLTANVSAALRSASFESRHFDLKPKIIQTLNLR
jgi:hypothetical protein